MRMELMNECMTSFSAYMFLSIARASEQGIFSTNADGSESLMVGDPSLEYVMGDYIIRLIILQIIVNIIDVFYNMLKDSWRKFKINRIKKKNKLKLIKYYEDYVKEIEKPPDQSLEAVD